MKVDMLAPVETVLRQYDKHCDTCGSSDMILALGSDVTMSYSTQTNSLLLVSAGGTRLIDAYCNECEKYNS